MTTFVMNSVYFFFSSGGTPYFVLYNFDNNDRLTYKITTGQNSWYSFSNTFKSESGTNVEDQLIVNLHDASNNSYLKQINHNGSKPTEEW